MPIGDTDTFTADTMSAPEDYASSEGGPISAPRIEASPGSKNPPLVVRPMQRINYAPPIPKDALGRAYHTLDFYQRNPQFLADPDTMHAAQLDLANSSKMIEMSISLGRVNAMADAAEARNGTAKEVGRNLLLMQRMGGKAAQVAAKWNALGTDGEPLWRDSSNWSQIIADSAIIETQRTEEEQRKADMRAQAQIDVGDARHENRMAEIEASQGGRGSGVQYPEPTIKEVGGKSFMFYRNFSPKPLDRLTPQQQQMLNVNVAGLKEARKKLTDATDDATRDDAQKVYNRELATFNEFFDMVSPRAAATTGANAPAATERILDKDTALQILNEAGGDKDKARDLARQRGYKF